MNSISAHVKNLCQHDATGHDWWHIHRVRRTALFIARQEMADATIVELAALLHDLDDWKFNHSHTELPLAQEILKKFSIDSEPSEMVLLAISEVSFKGAGVATTPTTIEAKVVQDADRLDAMGAIGIARAFAFGASKGQHIYKPEQTPTLHATFDAYRNSRTSTINHFYEKLLLLKDRLNTDTARKLAMERHRFMEQFLEQFFREWDFEP